MKKKISSLFIASVLVGCNGIDSSDGNNSVGNNKPMIPPTGGFVAYNGVAIIKVGEAETVDLRNYVEGGDRIIQLTPNEAHCLTPQSDNMHFSVKFDTASYCSYQYVVANHAGQTQSATITVLSTSTDDPRLPPISQAMNIGSTNQQFDLELLLGSNWQPTYSLNTNSISIVTAGNTVPGTATASANTITFEAPLAGGWNRILYTVADSAAPDVAMLGTIYVTLSENINDAPVISNLNYRYTNPIIASQSELIDVSTLPDLVISDDDDWQLIDVQSFSANVEPVSVSAVTNKQFTFVTPTVGEHSVSYTVTDHRGGFATGLMSMTVEPNESAKTWADIEITSRGNQLTFTATPQYSEAYNKGFDVKSYWDSGVSNSVASFTAEQAGVYCADIGIVPKTSELQQMYAHGMAGNTLSGDFSALPKELNYLVRQDQDLNFQTFSLLTGNAAELVADEKVYVTCLQSNRLELETLTSNLIANGNDHHLLNLQKPAGSVTATEVMLVNGSRMTLSDINVDIVANNASSDAILVNSIAVGQFKIKVDVGGEELISPIFTAVSDAASARVSAVNYDSVDQDGEPYVLADGVSRIKATATIADANSNIVSDTLVLFDGLGSGDITDNAGGLYVSDQHGQIEVDLISNTAVTFNDDPYEKTYSYDLVVNGVSDTYQFTIKHANYYDELEVSNVVEHGRYMSALLRVKSQAGVYRAANIEIVGGNRGSIFYSDEADENQGVLTDINVPIEGAKIYVSHAVSNRTASYTFALSGSPNRPSVEYESSVKTTSSVSTADTSLATGSSTQLSKEEVFALLENYDTLELYRYASSHGQTFYLPQLTPDDFGKVVKWQNMGITGRLRGYNLANRYFTAGFANGSTTCPVNAVFWNGSDWTAFGLDFKPNMDIVHNQCRGSVLPE